jgi:glyoxylase I family protein
MTSWLRAAKLFVVLILAAPVAPAATIQGGTASGVPGQQVTVSFTLNGNGVTKTIGAFFEFSTPPSTIAQAASFHGVRYLVSDVQRAVDFYTNHLGLHLEHGHLPEFATVALGALKIHLSGPGASGSRALPGGESQAAGGSNRIVLRVRDLPAVIESLRRAGVTFRNEMETGPAGSQIQLLDPDDNPVELFEPAR